MEKHGLKKLIVVTFCGLCMAACSKEELPDNVLAETQVTVPSRTPQIDGSGQMAGDTSAGYQFVPLEQYLPGEWRLDPRLVSVDADFRNGLWSFLATYVLHDALVDSPIGNDVESIIFDTAGNAFFRGTNRESVDETYVICQDSVARIGGLNDDWNTKVFQLNADSIVVCGYNPVGVSSPMIMVDEGWLFYRVME